MTSSIFDMLKKPEAADGKDIQIYVLVRSMCDCPIRTNLSVDGGLSRQRWNAF